MDPKWRTLSRVGEKPGTVLGQLLIGYQVLVKPTPAFELAPPPSIIPPTKPKYDARTVFAVHHALLSSSAPSPRCCHGAHMSTQVCDVSGALRAPSPRLHRASHCLAVQTA